MKISKPKFWLDEKIGVISILLFPFSFLFLIIHTIKRKLSLEKKFKIPIICVGNIYVGGTGKTPLSIRIANKIKNNKKTVIIRKYYKNHKDEYELIKHNTNLLFSSNRVKAVQLAEKNNFDIAILDDGFQDYSLKKDLNIICFNSNQLIGNGLVLPSGPLRERLDSIKRAKIVIINGDKNKIFEQKLINISNNIKIFYTNYLPLDIDRFKNKKIFAFAGIGNPNNFFETLKKYNLNIKKTMSFPDHYEYKKFEIDDIFDYAKKNGLQTLTTEKDYYRIKHMGINNIEYSKVELQIYREDEFFDQILKNLW